MMRWTRQATRRPTEGKVLESSSCVAMEAGLWAQIMLTKLRVLARRHTPAARALLPQVHAPSAYAREKCGSNGLLVCSAKLFKWRCCISRPRCKLAPCSMCCAPWPMFPDQEATLLHHPLWRHGGNPCTRWHAAKSMLPGGHAQNSC